MRMIQWNKKYGDDEDYVIYELIGEGKKALKIKITEFEDGDAEDEEIFFIQKKSIKGSTGEAIVFAGEQGRKWFEGDYDYVDIGNGNMMEEIIEKALNK